MAEGGIVQKQGRVRPLLPPKPTGCFPTRQSTSTTAGVKSVRTVARGNSRSCMKHGQKSSAYDETSPTEKIGETVKPPTLITELKKQHESKETKQLVCEECSEHEPCEEQFKSKSVSPKRQVLTRPQIFPKPQTPIKSEKFVVRTESAGPGSSRNGSAHVVSKPAVEQHSGTVVQKSISHKHISTGAIARERKDIGKLCIKTDKTAGSERGAYHALHIRAPVANFEEFDCLPESDGKNAPIRPPRSPKNKPPQGNIFLRCIESNLFLNSKEKYISSNPPSAVLSKFENSDIQKAKHLGIKAKSASLGRYYTGHSNQIHRINISLDRNDDVPIPPPRRRRKSVTDILPTKELESHPDFACLTVDTKPRNSFPEYATVNYSQKRNRLKQNFEQVEHSEDQTSNRGSEKNLKLDNFLEIRRSLRACKEVCEVCSHPDEVNFKQATRVNSSQSVKHDGQLSKIAADMDTAASTAVSETCRLDKEVSSNTDNSLSSTAFINADNKDKATVISEDICVSKSQSEDCLHSSEQDTTSQIRNAGSFSNESDVCGICPQEKPMSDLHDSSSSSKIEWLSVNSSFHNSSNEVEKKVVEVDESSCKQSYEEKIDLCMENSNVSILLDDSSSDLVEICTSQKTVSQCVSSTEVCEPSCDLAAVQAGGINNVTDTSVYAKNESEATPEQKLKSEDRSARENLIYGVLSDDSLTSSTPSLSCSFTHRSIGVIKKHARRLSWSSCRDRISSMRNDTRGRGNSLSLWHDDGDLSSGALADLDSSDNTARQSSVEDVFHNSENDIVKNSQQWNVFSKHQEGLVCNEDCASVSSSSQDNEYSILCGGLVQNCATGSKTISEQQCTKKNAHSDQEVTDNTETSQHSDSEATSHCREEGATTHATSQQRAKKAFYIAKELMTSERVFISVLQLLNVDFRQAVEMARKQYQAQIIPKDDFYKIFNSLPQLQSLNEDLLHDLEGRIENWESSKKIADVIVRKGPFLKLYTTYIQNFGAQCSHFDECCQKYPKFCKLVKDFEALPICHKLSIKHFMLKPVQRIPQYRLLLEDYFRQLDPTSPDYEDTQRALRIVSDVADHANRSIKLGDHLSKLLQLQAQLNNYEIIKPGRIFLREGELLKLSRKDSQPRYFILLNDCLLYTSYYGSGLASGLKVNSELPLGGMKVSTPQAEDFHNEFSIISSTRSFTLMARSEEERQEWVDALQAAIKDFTSRQLSFQKLNAKNNDIFSETFKLGKEVPVWIQDGRVTKCQCCVAVFTVTFRRHHCRACGKVVCSNCSDFRAPLQYKRFQPDRVCVDCYESLLAEYQNEGRMKHCIETELKITDYEELTLKYREIKSHFKKLGTNGRRKYKKYVPQRLLEVTANDTGSQMSGWLQKRKKNSWKRYWFVLKDQVLYIYKASEDVAALETVPVLGYVVEQMKEPFDGRDAKLVFQLKHEGQAPLMFSADSEHLANRWISAIQEATVLKE